jgi:hypothetical protein
MLVGFVADNKQPPSGNQSSAPPGNLDLMKVWLGLLTFLHIAIFLEFWDYEDLQTLRRGPHSSGW